MNTKKEIDWNYILCGNQSAKPVSHKCPLGRISISNSWNKVPIFYGFFIKYLTDIVF